MKLIKSLLARVSSLFAADGVVVGFDHSIRSYRVFNRGRMVSLRAVCGAAYGDLEAAVPAQVLAIANTATTEIGPAPSVEDQPSYTVSKVSLATLTAVVGVGAAGAGATGQVRKTPAAGGVAVVVATLAFNAGVNSVAETELNFPLSAVAGAITVQDGDVFDFQWVQGATGLALPAAVVKVEFN